MRCLPILGTAVGLFAHDPVTTRLTWSAEISRIVYKRCAGCHNDGGKTPVALLDYEQVRPWAKAIRDEVLARRMPPWGAVKGFGEFQGDISLTQDEISRIADWVEGGAPEGDRRFLPARSPGPMPAGRVPRGLRLRNPKQLGNAVIVIGIAPKGDITTAKIVGRKPDGTVEPLLWLLNYRDRWQRTFVFKQPVPLPAGTTVHANPAISFDLVVRQTSATPIVKSTVLTTPRR